MLKGKTKSQKWFLRYQQAELERIRQENLVRYCWAGTSKEVREKRAAALQKAAECAQRIRDEILQATEPLSEIQRSVVRARYLDLRHGAKLRQWADIAADVGLTEKHVIFLHRLALESVCHPNSHPRT